MNIHVLGVATSKFGELWEVSPRALAREVIVKALHDAKKSPEEIDALFVGNMLAGTLGNQANLGSFFAEELGVAVPAFRLEGACASGGLAVHAAITGILSGRYHTVLALGIEKMTDGTLDESIAGLMAAGSDEERLAGATFPGIYALMAQAYMRQYAVSEEVLAAVSVKNHYHGSQNPNAQFRRIITIADVMKSSKIADPLKLLDCSPISDGAAALVLSGENKKNKTSTVSIVASEVATDTLALHERKSLTTLNAVAVAAQKAYQQAGIQALALDVAEVHDCFSIAEVLGSEDLGFSKRGQGAQDIADGKRTLGNGDIIVNPSGGLKACGHPIGATGIKQIVEIVLQLRGEAGLRQVQGAKIGLTHNVGGSGAMAAVHILRV